MGRVCIKVHTHQPCKALVFFAEVGLAFLRSENICFAEVRQFGLYSAHVDRIFVNLVHSLEDLGCPCQKHMLENIFDNRHFT